MSTCLLMRAPLERVSLEIVEFSVVATMGRWNQVRQVVEAYANEQEARDRYEEMKVICVVDYNFHVVMEN